MTWSNPQTIGTVSGQPIIAELGPGLGSDALVAVTLSATYVRTPPPGYPAPTPAGAANGSATQAPGTILSGTTLKLPKPEAAALVTAGAASYS